MKKRALASSSEVWVAATRRAFRRPALGVKITSSALLGFLAGSAPMSLRAEPWAGELTVEAAPGSGWTSRGLELTLSRLTRGAPEFVLRSGAGAPVPPASSCGEGAVRLDGGRLVARLSESRSALEWRTPDGCVAARSEAPWRPAEAENLLRSQLGTLASELRALSSAGPAPPVAASPASLPSTPPELSATPGGPSDASPGAAAARERSRARLSRVPGPLAEAVKARLHHRHRPGARAAGFIDAAGLAEQVLRQARGLEIGSTLREQLSSGRHIGTGRSAIEALRPGDLLFTTSFAGVPRSVMIVLGRGLQATAKPIQGVVVAPIPKKVPNHLHLVAIRPEPGARNFEDADPIPLP